MDIFRATGWLVTAGVAIFTSMSSFVIANQVKAPELSYAVGYPPTGTVQANVASQTYSARLLKYPETAVTAGEQKLARQSYRAEPLSTTALGLIILPMTDDQKRRALLQLAGEITRRNALINLELIKSAALSGDDRSFFLWLSRSVLANNELRTAYVGALANATAKDGAVEVLEPVIGPSPMWAEYYWQRVAQVQPSLTNAAKLRVAVARAPWRQTEITQSDQSLSLGLVNSGQFDAAYQLVQGLRAQGASTTGTANLLVNANFGRQPQLLPFDWKLAVSGGLGSSIDDKSESLFVSAIGGARGVAASQLVRLSPGNYVLGWSLTPISPIDSGVLSARIHCAEPGVKAVMPLPIGMVEGKKNVPVTIPDSACRWYWVSLYVAVPDDSVGIDVYFRYLTLTPVMGNDVRTD